MKKFFVSIVLTISLLKATADEGMWLPMLLGQQVYNDMVKRGLKLTKEQRALMASSEIATWKRKQKSEAKKKSIDLAKKMFKECESEMTKVKHDGVAEALLIANWLRRQYVK